MTLRFFIKLLAGVFYATACFAAPLFLAAGTIRWPRAWVLVGVVFLGGTAAMFGIFRTRPDLLAERLKPPIQKGQPLADRVIILALLASFFGLMAFAALDVFRWRLLGGPGLPVSVLGLVLFMTGWAIQAQALRDNAFAAPVVRHQEERRQVVVDRGLYALVRHPMYAGGIPLFVGLALWLGSYAAAVATVVPLAILIARIHVEERLLTRELPGYEAYMRKVRWRMVPGVW
jgi:protein-S-isoprenylcysteine O-methyltransferase Ste14